MTYPSSPGMRAVAMVMLALIGVTSVQGNERSVGPDFINEPPGLVEFINSMGTHVDCSASGHPLPSVNWVSVDNTLVTNISGIRTVLTNGTLVLHPFRSEQYRPDVHAAMYRCHVTNSVGTITSSVVQIRAVLQQPYDVQVYDSFAMEGNTAVFKCHLPTVIEDYIEVVAWIKNDNLLIQSKENEGSLDKYIILPTGELHIQDVNSGDAGTKYKCKTVHRLTGETQVSSSAGQLFVTESRGTIQPRILDSITAISTKRGKEAVMSCVTQGNPPLSLKWKIRNKHGLMINVPQNSRYIQTRSTLVIQDVQTSDEGVYSCEASSDLGKAQLDITLTVKNDMSVRITPKVNLAKFGDMAEFNCDISGPETNSIQWLHNGSPLAQQMGKVLKLTNIQISDQGMFQCMVKSNSGTFQASSELRLTEIVPQWAETFQEIAAHPGVRVSVQCIAKGIPLPTISWSVDGSTISKSGNYLVTSMVDKEGRPVSKLTINSAAVEDGGLYKCTATNNGGDAHHSARINIYGPLQVRRIPTVMSVSGSNINLNCPVFGYPWSLILWEKDGVHLPAEIRHSVMKNGSLLIENVNRLNDNGNFTCRIQGNNNENVIGSVNLQVLVPPKIVPFEFQDELLREGMRARLQCVVSDGDLPLNVSWLKDGMPMSHEIGVLVRTLDEFSSILTISSIRPGHNGNYTCIATNKAATVTHTAELSVNGK